MPPSTVALPLKELCLTVTNLQCLHECRNSLTDAGVPFGAVKVRTKRVIAQQSSCELVLDAHADPFETPLFRGYICVTIANDCACVRVQCFLN